MTRSLGSADPGINSYHNNRQFSTEDNDNDASGGNCPANYNGGPWWYGACWSGSVWGGCGESSHQNGPYWHSSTSAVRNHAAIWLRF